MEGCDYGELPCRYIDTYLYMAMQDADEYAAAYKAVNKAVDRCGSYCAAQNCMINTLNRLDWDMRSVELTCGHDVCMHSLEIIVKIIMAEMSDAITGQYFSYCRDGQVGGCFYVYPGDEPSIHVVPDRILDLATDEYERKRSMSEKVGLWNEAMNVN